MTKSFPIANIFGMKNENTAPTLDLDNISTNKFDLFIFWSVVAIVAICPLYFSYLTYRTFDTSKASFFKVSMSLVSILWALRMATRPNFEGIWHRTRPMAIPLALFGFFYLQSTIFSTDPWMSVVGIYYKQVGLAGYLDLILIYFILVTTAPKEFKLSHIAWPVVISGIIVAVHGYFQVMGWYPLGLPKIEVSSNFPRLTGLTGNPNITANTLVMIFPLIGVLHSYEGKKNWTWWQIGLFILFGLAIFQTLTRGTWVALFSITFIWFLLQLGSNQDQDDNLVQRRVFTLIMVFSSQLIFSSLLVANLSRWFFVGLGAILHMVVFFLIIKFEKFHRLERKYATLGAVLTLALATFLSWVIIFQLKGTSQAASKFISIFRFEESIRFQVWINTFRLIAEHFFLGVGPETFRQNFSPYNSPQLEIMTPNINFDNPHNNYLYIFASVGIFGFLAYLLILFVPVFKGIKFFLQNQNIRGEQMTFIVCSILGYCFWTLTGFEAMSSLPVLYFAFALFALGTFKNLPAKPFPTTLLPIKILIVALIPFHAWNAYDSVQRYRADSALAYGYRNRKVITKDEMVKRHKEATLIYPNESFYALKLGDAFFYRGKNHPVKTTALEYIKLADKQADIAFNHSWAPENVCLLKIKIASTLGDLRSTGYWIDRALEHSPHTKFLVQLKERYKNQVKATRQQVLNQQAQQAKKTP